MSSPFVIMLSGYLQSGKDAVGKRLCGMHGFTRLAFADMLKDEVSALYSLKRADMDTQEGKDTPIDDKHTVRSILIKHGCMRRKRNENYWVDAVLAKIGSHKRVVITDWRFPNEYNRISDHAVVSSWRVERWEKPPIQDESETALDTFVFDKCIRNGGTLEDLYEAVDQSVLPPPFVLVDVDEVLLRWVDGFRRFLESRGYMFTTEYPSDWGMAGWICDKSGRIEVITELVAAFNNSSGFSELEPYVDAQLALRRLKNITGCRIVAISSCSDDAVAKENRRVNIGRHFSGIVDDIVCLPLGSSKRETLAKFPPSVWIDDNIENVVDGALVGHIAFLLQRPWTDNHSTFPVSVKRAKCWDEIISTVFRRVSEDVFSK